MAALDERRDADIHKVLRHHDTQLASLTVEVGSIKSSLDNQGAVLHEIRGVLGDLRGKQGPGFGAMLKGIATGGAIVGMSAAAITVLVTSFVSPDITKLKTEAIRTEKYVEHQELADRKELAEYRRKTADRIESKLEALTAAVAGIKWMPRVEPARK